MYYLEDPVHIRDFEWDDGNTLHITLKHGIEREEAEELLAGEPMVRKTKHGHYAAFGRALSGRLLVIVFEKRRQGIVRVITGWDMSLGERRYYLREREG
jgi:uncharacterized DUF497 family protein